MAGMTISPRNEDVARLLIAGCQDNEIAEELGIRTRTVKARLANLFVAYGIERNNTLVCPRIKLAVMLLEEKEASDDPVSGSGTFEDLVKRGRITPKQQQIIRLVRQGFSNRMIADRIGTTENVVKNYCRVIYDVLGFSNRLELALWAAHCRVCD